MRGVRTRRAFASLWLTLGASGCAGWSTTDVAPRELLRERGSVSAVRVVKRDSSRVELYDPVLVADSIRGATTQRAVARITVPLSDITEIAVRKTSLGKTALVVLAVGGGVALYALLMSLNEAY